VGFTSPQPGQNEWQAEPTLLAQPTSAAVG